MAEPEDITALPPFARGVIDSMREDARQKWYEAAVTFFSRAIINRAVSIECQIAGFSEAQHHFEQRTLYFIAEGFRCLAFSGYAASSGPLWRSSDLKREMRTWE